VLAVLTAACGTNPVLAPDARGGQPEARTPLTGAAAAFEQRLRERALVQQREGRLAEASQSWEILVALRPDAGDYRDRFGATRRQIDALLPERMQRAQQAWKRGELDAASSQFLAVLALQPEHVQAAEALRSIERERNRALYLGKLSRITLARGGALRSARPGAADDRNDVEHAAILRTQGETDAAIVLLERYVTARGADAAACRMLAEMYLQKSGATGRIKQAGTAGPPTASSPCP